MFSTPLRKNEAGVKAFDMGGLSVVVRCEADAYYEATDTWEEKMVAWARTFFSNGESPGLRIRTHVLRTEVEINRKVVDERKIAELKWAGTPAMSLSSATASALEADARVRKEIKAMIQMWFGRMP